MADPGSVITIVQGLASTANFCFHIIKRVCKAPKEIKKLNAEISNWRPQLESLAEILAGDSDSATRLREKFKDGGFNHVKDLVKDLNDILGPFQNPSHFQKFKWSAVTGSQVEELLRELEHEMEIILRTLQMGTYIDVIDLQKEIRHIQTFETNEHERRNILQWLKPAGIDAQEFHHQKRSLREQGTCDWLSNSGPWLDWCKGGSERSSRFLWIHGLPGAGKTVLASFAIDQVATMYQHKGVSYYYCSHERHRKGHTSSEEACSFLRWVIRDLTSQLTRLKTGPSSQHATIPKILQDLYEKHDLSTQSLLECLLAVTEYITGDARQQVCIIVDAVDESPFPRDALLGVLTAIGTGPEWQHVSLCFTSRKEMDISKAIDAIQPAPPARSAGSSPIPTSPPTRTSPTPSGRTILVAYGPGGSRHGDPPPRGRVSAGGFARSGFDGGSPGFRNSTMPPPPRGATRLERGRNPSGGSFDLSNAPHRMSRSEIRVPSVAMTPYQSERARSMSVTTSEASRGFEPMDIDIDPPGAGAGDPFSHHVREGCTILSLDDNPDVKEAIRTFVRNQLQDNETFETKRPENLEEVVNLIAKKAKGMFRWAACQVDIIIRSNLCDMDSVSQMLEKIPPDIFSTYEHMITRLLPGGQGQNEHNRNFARTALALICSPTSGVPCAEVLVEASRFNVPHGSASNFNLAHLEKILGCLITVTRLNRRPDSMYNRNKEDDADARKHVSVAHYTVKEYLFDKSTASGKVKEFALSTEAIQNLELQVIFNGLKQFGSNRYHRDIRDRYPTLYEEYCLKETDRALKDRRGLILRDKTVWKAVTECLRWDSKHHLPRSGAFPNMKTRAAFPSWTKTSPFEPKSEPKITETSVLVSLALLQWPKLAKVYLADLPEATKKQVWEDRFELARGFRVEGTNPATLMQLCVTRRDTAFLQVLIESKADFSGETHLVMDLFYNAYGHRSLDDQDGGAKTSKMLKMLLERGVRPEAPGYIFTPLQFAVSNLEDRWVRDLLYEGADPNATGNPDGVHLFDDEQDQIQGDLTPLQICRETEPKWLQSEQDGGGLMDEARRKVAESLIQFGAEEPVVIIDSD